MKKINVIDLDHTLINFDSFRKYVLNFFRRGDLFLAFLIFQRKIKVLSSPEFKMKVTLRCRPKHNYEQQLKLLSEFILQNINEEIISKINNHSDERTINVLSTASISDYVTLVAEKLGWVSISTIVEDDHVNHNYGKQKQINLLNSYPKDRYQYNFAISDSETDLELLKLFNKYELIT